MSWPNQNSRYGAIAKALSLSPQAKVFFVTKSQAWSGDFNNEFPADSFGVPRVYASLAAIATAAPYVAARGDVVLVMQGHTETVSTATALSLAVSGVSFIGMGNGSNRPTITLDTGTGATINVTANGITIQNMIFVANFAAIVSCFTTTTATDFTLLDCEFRDTSVSLNFKFIVDTDATSNHTDGLRIENCKRTGLGATSGTGIIKMDGTNDRLTVKNNYFTHASVVGGGLMPIATGKVVTNALITGNICNFVNATSITTGILITTDGSTNSGVLASNFVQGLDDTAPILVTASSGFVFFDNKYGATADASGFLLPAAGS